MCIVYSYSLDASFAFAQHFPKKANLLSRLIHVIWIGAVAGALIY